jgi:hypothetical protein
VRILRHVGGRFGLDRVDLRVGFKDGRKLHAFSRTVVRRNGPQLAALARVRLHGDVEKLSDDDLKDGLEYAAYLHGVTDRMGFAEGSPWPVRVYPTLLAQFEPPVKEEGLLSERRTRQEALGDRMKLLSPYFISTGAVPRPHFAEEVGACH